VFVAEKSIKKARWFNGTWVIKTIEEWE